MPKIQKPNHDKYHLVIKISWRQICPWLNNVPEIV